MEIEAFRQKLSHSSKVNIDDSQVWETEVDQREPSVDKIPVELYDLYSKLLYLNCSYVLLLFSHTFKLIFKALKITLKW